MIGRYGEGDGLRQRKRLARRPLFTRCLLVDGLSLTRTGNTSSGEPVTVPMDPLVYREILPHCAGHGTKQ